MRHGFYPMIVHSFHKENLFSQVLRTDPVDTTLNKFPFRMDITSLNTTYLFSSLLAVNFADQFRYLFHTTCLILKQCTSNQLFASFLWNLKLLILRVNLLIFLVFKQLPFSCKFRILLTTIVLIVFELFGIYKVIQFKWLENKKIKIFVRIDLTTSRPCVHYHNDYAIETLVSGRLRKT